MTKLILIISICFALFGEMLVMTSDTSAQDQKISDMDAVVKGNTVFAFNLYEKLKQTKGNLFFSPYSISTALGMTYAGARGNTEKEMAQALCFTLESERLHPGCALLEKALNAVQEKGGIRLNVANSLWPQKGYDFLPEFLDLVKKNYGVLITPLDYQQAYETARKKINEWVEKKTDDKIRELIQPGILDPLTRLVLVNAIYFKGNWMSQFDKSLTKDGLFWLSSEKSVMTPMMTQKRAFRYAETRDLQILDLPYDGDDLSMIMLLPKKRDGLAELEKALTAENLDKWTMALRTRDVRVFAPKFKLTSQFRLDQTLVSMGMGDAFDVTKADFSGMDGRKPWLYISAVIHKAFVDVNEQGTEAAAATAVVMSVRGMSRPEPPAIFRADHPFIFLIRDHRSKSILFFGRIENPNS